MAASDELGASDVVDCIVNLVAKSLLTAVGSAVAQYRLLETTRAYALEKLTQSGELAAVRAPPRRVLPRRVPDRRGRMGDPAAPANGWPPTAARSTTCARRWTGPSRPAAIAEIGVALTVAAVPLWMHLSLMEECRAARRAGAREPGPRTEPRHARQHAAVRRAGLSL